MSTPLSETFAINNRINLYLLNAIDDGALTDVPSGSKGRNVGEQFAHINNVRLMWLKVASPALMSGLAKIEKEAGITKTILQTELQLSGEAIIKLFEESETTGKIKGFKPHAAGFLGYLISHESHHRGQVMLTLKQNGHMVDKKIQFGIWEWGVR